MIQLSILGIILLLFLWYVLKPRPKDENGFKMWFFSERSWHARYYKLIVGKLPQGGCVYFWVMIALILLSPLFLIFWILFKLSDLNTNRLNKKNAKRTPEQKRKREEKLERRGLWMEKFGEYLGKTLVILMLLFALGVIIYAILEGKRTNLWHFLEICSIVLLFVGIIILLRWLCLKIHLGRYIIKILKPLGYPFKYIWSIIVAIYTKSCPKITWNK